MYVAEIYDVGKVKLKTKCLGRIESKILQNLITVKPAKAVTSIKQSPVLKGHLFLVLSYKNLYEMNLF
jgi:hypothetical protein